MDKQLEKALLQNLIIKTKIVIGFFIFYFVLNLFSIYEIINRELDISSSTLLYLFPLIPALFIIVEYRGLIYLKGIDQGNYKYNKNYLFPISIMEISYPTITIIFIAQIFIFPGSSFEPLDMLNVSQFMIYVLFILLSSLHFDFKLSAFVGILAFAEFLFIILYYVDINDNFQDSYPILLKTIYLIPFGFIAGLVSKRIKKATLESLAAKNILINELDIKVKERTLEIEKQKEIVEEKNTEILDSIHYASRIQSALLPNLKSIDKYLDNFILYLPKDIIAGDFYWFYAEGDEVYIAVADCTGHGVPGAMVSVVCANALNKTVKELRIKEPGKILEKCREIVINTLDEGQNDIQDGMDISFSKINLKTRKLSYAGAHNPLYRITEKTEEIYDKAVFNDSLVCLQYKGDNQSIGRSPIVREFTQYDIQLLEGDTIYLITDGYPDQFGGPNDKKFLYKPFKQMLLDFHEESLEKQKTILNETFLTWKGNRAQIDDVCVMGIHIR